MEYFVIGCRAGDSSAELKGKLSSRLICSAMILAVSQGAFADTLTLFNGGSITGTVLQTNGENLLLLTDYGTLRYGVANLKKIQLDPPKQVPISTNRLPESKSLILLLSRQSWASNIEQIPATVIDNGMLRHVPYISFRCGDDYEVNVYGDLDRPAGIEVGVYRKLLTDESAKRNCLKLVSDLMGQTADKGTLQGLNLEKDIKTRDSLTFEITPPTAEDAYMGWWVSVYSQQKLNLARASDEELKNISVPKITATTQSDWSARELELSRPAGASTITFTNKSGIVIKDAEIVRTNKGVSLVWRDAGGGGVVRLADLPPNLQARFGYDSEMSDAADQAEKAKRTSDWQQQAQAQSAQIQASPVQDTPGTVYSSSYSSSRRSSDGSVYVRSYYRKDGTLVQAHTRSAPHHR